MDTNFFCNEPLRDGASNDPLTRDLVERLSVTPRVIAHCSRPRPSPVLIVGRWNDATHEHAVAHDEIVTLERAAIAPRARNRST